MRSELETPEGTYCSLLHILICVFLSGRYSANFYNAINHKSPSADNLNDGEAIPVKQTIFDILTSARAAEEKVSEFRYLGACTNLNR